jgi:hypothetical protein
MLKATAVLAAVLAVAGIALALTSGDDEDAAGARMTLERSVSPTGRGEVLVTVTGDADVPPRAKAVALRCLDRRDRPVTAARYPWPLQKDDQEPQPHIHQPAAPSELERIERCRIGTRPSLTAKLPLR